jgi:hypothetical protein
MTPHMGLTDDYSDIYKINNIKFVNSDFFYLKLSLIQLYVEVLTLGIYFFLTYRIPLSNNFFGKKMKKMWQGLY